LEEEKEEEKQGVSSSRPNDRVPRKRREKSESEKSRHLRCSLKIILKYVFDPAHVERHHAQRATCEVPRAWSENSASAPRSRPPPQGERYTKESRATGRGRSTASPAAATPGAVMFSQRAQGSAARQSRAVVFRRNKKPKNSRTILNSNFPEISEYSII